MRSEMPKIQRILTNCWIYAINLNLLTINVLINHSLSTIKVTKKSNLSRCQTDGPNRMQMTAEYFSLITTPKARIGPFQKKHIGQNALPTTERCILKIIKIRQRIGNYQRIWIERR